MNGNPIRTAACTRGQAGIMRRNVNRYVNLSSQVAVILPPHVTAQVFASPPIVAEAWIEVFDGIPNGLQEAENEARTAILELFTDLGGVT